METGSKQTVDAMARRSHHVTAVLLVAATTLAAHGWSLDDGLFLDDHWHQVKLREASWSFGDLIDSTTIEPARWIQAWWQDQEVRWDYSRPLTMAWMKLVQSASGGSLPLQHLSCLAWHFVCCLLVYVLCQMVTRSPFWSGFAAILFVIYPHNVYTVGWLAAQNAIIQTTLTVGAVICYLRASGLRVSQAVGGVHAAVSSSADHEEMAMTAGRTADTAVARAAADTAVTRAAAVGSAQPRGWFAGVLMLFMLSLFARENAIVLPALLIAFDATFGGRKHLWARWKCHAILAGIAVGFVIWRMSAFDSSIPEVYLRRPGDAAYPSWLLAKLLHYVVCVIWEAPMMIGPTRHADPFASAPWDCALMILIVLVLGGAFWLACRRHVQGYWMWAIWILLAILPVAPIMATPHSAYMAGVAFVIAVVLKPAAVSAGRAKISTAVAWWMMGMSLFAFGVYRLAWQGIMAAEKYTIAQTAALEPPPPESHVFVINLPLVNIYLPVNLWQAWGYPATEAGAGGARPVVHVLTYSPHLLRGPNWSPPDGEHAVQHAPSDSNSPDRAQQSPACRISKLGPRSFLLTDDDRDYFSGALGEFLTRGMRRRGSFKAGEVVPGEVFDVEILDESLGLSGLKLTFREALVSEQYRFLVFTEDCPGGTLEFRNLVSDSHPMMGCREGPDAAKYRSARDLFPRIIAHARQIIRTELYLTAVEDRN